MEIIGLPLLMDNYAWLLVDRARSECAVVDPSQAAPVLERIAAEGLKLRWILATHHHWDHTGGIEELVDASGAEVEVFGSLYDREQDRIPRITAAFGEDDTFEVCGSEAKCLMVPGHTLGAIAFYFAAERAVFTGDTLFTAGCGRLFEGDAAMMHASLSRLAQLPDDTAVYCGHEYTQKNLSFAASVLPDDEAIRLRREEVDALRERGEPTVPALLSLERTTNPFLRADEETVATAVATPAGAATFAEIRSRRDSF